MLFEIEYPFDEIEITGNGTLAYGVAVLTDDQGGSDEFYVSKIVLDDGTELKPKNTDLVGAPDPFLDGLFKRIADRIEKLEHAAEAYARELAESRQPDPDLAYEEYRDNLMHAHLAAAE